MIRTENKSGLSAWLMELRRQQLVVFKKRWIFRQKNGLLLRNFHELEYYIKV